MHCILQKIGGVTHNEAMNIFSMLFFQNCNFIIYDEPTYAFSIMLLLTQRSDCYISKQERNAVTVIVEQQNINNSTELFQQYVVTIRTLSNIISKYNSDDTIYLLVFLLTTQNNSIDFY